MPVMFMYKVLQHIVESNIKLMYNNNNNNRHTNLAIGKYCGIVSIKTPETYHIYIVLVLIQIKFVD